jgi:hypothetical protein
MMSLWIALLTPHALAGVTINEILADPGAVVDANCDGVIDSGDDEFVEIVNVGPGSFDLSGATFEDATSVRYTFPSGTVIPELNAVVLFSNGVPALDGSAGAGAPEWCVNIGGRAEVHVAGGTLSLNNSGDTLILRDSNATVLDQVDYGTAADNDQSIVRDLELIGTTFVRHSSVSPTGALASPGSMADIKRFEIPTGEPTGNCDGVADAQGVVINEFLTNAPGTDEPFEWVELYNGGSQSVDLSGWALAAGTSSLSPGDPFPNGTTIPAGGILLVAQSLEAAAGVDLVNLGWGLGNATSTADGVQLQDCDGAIVDTVIYGDPNDDEFVDDSGNIATSLAPAPKEGASMARMPNGKDTDKSANDFVEHPQPTPGVPNDEKVDSPCGGATTGVVVNELASNPEGADTSFEWVELFHAGNTAIDLTGWKVQAATSSWSTFYLFEGGTLQPGEYLVVGGEFAPNVDLITASTLGNGTSNADGVRILDCAGFTVDTVLYGSPNEDEFLDDNGVIAARTAAAPGEGASLQRVQDGYDTNDSQADFAETYAPSPGATNPELEPVVCVPSDGSVTINEFIPDPDGSDAGLEWIELYNDSSKPISIAGWGVAAGTSDYGSLDIVFPGGTEVPAGGYFVVGGEFVEEADLVVEFSLGNGTGTDGLQLVDCDNNAVDTVVYGEVGNEDLMTDDNGEVVEPYGDPGSNESLARDTDGGDTDKAEDWIVTGLPTPGASNDRQAGQGGTDLLPSGGCGKKSKAPPASGDAPATEAPKEGGCTTVPMPLGGLEMGLLMLVGLRRRK